MASIMEDGTNRKLWIFPGIAIRSAEKREFPPVEGKYLEEEKTLVLNDWQRRDVVPFQDGDILRANDGQYLFQFPPSVYMPVLEKLREAGGGRAYLPYPEIDVKDIGSSSSGEFGPHGTDFDGREW